MRSFLLGPDAKVGSAPKLTFACLFSLHLIGALFLSACDRANPSGDVDGSGISVKGGYEGPRPEGVSTTHDPVTTTLYLDQAGISDMYEIQAAEVALSRSKNEKVRGFAQMMRDHHSRTLAALKQFVADNPVNRAIPQNLDARRQAMIENLKGAPEDEFDHDYLGQQAAAHDEAYNLHRSFANGRDYPKLGDLAAGTADLVDRHRRTLASIRSSSSDSSGAKSGKSQNSNGG